VPIYAQQTEHVFEIVPFVKRLAPICRRCATVSDSPAA
jgi:hypothetical protein